MYRLHIKPTPFYIKDLDFGICKIWNQPPTDTEGRLYKSKKVPETSKLRILA